MKSFLFLALVVIGFTSIAQNSSNKVLKFDQVEIVRNDIPYDSKEMFVFNFINKTGQTVTVTNVQTSCGCTAAEKPENPIKKNKKGKILVRAKTIKADVIAAFFSTV